MFKVRAILSTIVVLALISACGAGQSKSNLSLVSNDDARIQSFISVGSKPCSDVAAFTGVVESFEQGSLCMVKVDLDRVLKTMTYTARGRDLGCATFDYEKQYSQGMHLKLRFDTGQSRWGYESRQFIGKRFNLFLGSDSRGKNIWWEFERIRKE